MAPPEDVVSLQEGDKKQNEDPSKSSLQWLTAVASEYLRMVRGCRQSGSNAGQVRQEFLDSNGSGVVSNLFTRAEDAKQVSLAIEIITSFMPSQSMLSALLDEQLCPALVEAIEANEDMLDIFCSLVEAMALSGPVPKSKLERTGLTLTLMSRLAACASNQEVALLLLKTLSNFDYREPAESVRQRSHLFVRSLILLLKLHGPNLPVVKAVSSHLSSLFQSTMTPSSCTAFDAFVTEGGIEAAIATADSFRRDLLQSKGEEARAAVVDVLTKGEEARAAVVDVLAAFKHLKMPFTSQRDAAFDEVTIDAIVDLMEMFNSERNSSDNEKIKSFTLLTYLLHLATRKDNSSSPTRSRAIKACFKMFLSARNERRLAKAIASLLVQLSKAKAANRDAILEGEGEEVLNQIIECGHNTASSPAPETEDRRRAMILEQRAREASMSASPEYRDTTRNRPHQQGHSHHDHPHQQGHSHHDHPHQQGHTHHDHPHQQGHSHHDHHGHGHLDGPPVARAPLRATTRPELYGRQRAEAGNRRSPPKRRLLFGDEAVGMAFGVDEPSHNRVEHTQGPSVALDVAPSPKLDDKSHCSPPPRPIHNPAVPLGRPQSHAQRNGQPFDSRDQSRHVDHAGNVVVSTRSEHQPQPQARIQQDVSFSCKMLLQYLETPPSPSNPERQGEQISQLVKDLADTVAENDRMLAALIKSKGDDVALRVAEWSLLNGAVDNFSHLATIIGGFAELDCAAIRSRGNIWIDVAALGIKNGLDEDIPGVGTISACRLVTCVYCHVCTEEKEEASSVLSEPLVVLLSKLSHNMERDRNVTRLMGAIAEALSVLIKGMPASENRNGRVTRVCDTVEEVLRLMINHAEWCEKNSTGGNEWGYVARLFTALGSCFSKGVSYNDETLQIILEGSHWGRFPERFTAALEAIKALGVLSLQSDTIKNLAITKYIVPNCFRLLMGLDQDCRSIVGIVETLLVFAKGSALVYKQISELDGIVQLMSIAAHTPQTTGLELQLEVVDGVATLLSVLRTEAPSSDTTIYDPIEFVQLAFHLLRRWSEQTQLVREVVSLVSGACRQDSILKRLLVPEIVQFFANLLKSLHQQSLGPHVSSIQLATFVSVCSVLGAIALTNNSVMVPFVEDVRMCLDQFVAHASTDNFTDEPSATPLIDEKPIDRAVKAAQGLSKLLSIKQAPTSPAHGASSIEADGFKTPSPVKVRYATRMYHSPISPSKTKQPSQEERVVVPREPMPEVVPQGFAPAGPKTREGPGPLNSGPVEEYLDHLTRGAIPTNALTMVCESTLSDADLESLIAAGFVDTLALRLAKEHNEGNLSFVEAALTTLGNISKKLKLARSLLSVPFLGCMGALVSVVNTTSTLLQQVCCILEVLSFHPDSQSKFLEANVPIALLRILEVPTVESVVICACETIANIALDGSFSSYVEAHGLGFSHQPANDNPTLEVILSVMHKNKQSTRVVAACLNCLGNIAYEKANQVTDLVKVSAIPVALSILDQFKEEPLVCEAACCLLRNIAAVESIIPRLVEERVIPALVQCLRRHTERIEIALPIVDAVGNVAVDDFGVIDEFQRCEVIKHIACALQQHEHVEAIQQSGMGAMFNVSSTSGKRILLSMAERLVSIFSRAMGAFPSNKTLLELGGSLKQSLSSPSGAQTA